MVKGSDKPPSQTWVMHTLIIEHKPLSGNACMMLCMRINAAWLCKCILFSVNKAARQAETNIAILLQLLLQGETNLEINLLLYAKKNK